jgi:glycosyltransferase involved in cell wall biosynthesis
MKLSFLILTHNRPKLFQRCLNSVLNKISNDVEVIVNNDSSDIEEIKHKQVSYYYERFEHLSQVYEFLFKQSKGEYVYFLEDDDYLIKSFDFKFDADLIVGNYTTNYDIFHKFDSMTNFKDSIETSNSFIKVMKPHLLQLSQVIFKRETISDFIFPKDSNIYNDEKLIRHACFNSKKIITMNKIFFCQTIDGRDNISFPEPTKNMK